MRRAFVTALLLAIGAGQASRPAMVLPAPAADHHLHLRSPEITHLFGEQIPPIELPEEVQALLGEFEARWRARDASGLAALFTADGIMQIGRDWQWSPGGINLALLGRGGAVRFHAQAAAADGAIAYVAGSYRRDAEAPPGDRGRFMLALRRPDGAPWRIAAAMLGDLPAETRVPAVTVEETVAQLDAAGIRQAALLSFAYQFGGVGRQVIDAAAKVRAENDWTAQQAARFPGRLAAFCSFNPLEPYALGELDACMRDSRFAGLKLHFTTAGIDLRNPQHVDRLRAVFRAANARRFPIVVHMRTLNPAYGARDAEIFLTELLAEASDSAVQIAHLAGWGGFGPETEAAFGVFAEAAAAGDPRVRNLWFDISQIVAHGMPEQTTASLVRRLRQVGAPRILFAIDGPVSAEPWERLVKLLPLDDAELKTIASNVAPYMRRQ